MCPSRCGTPAPLSAPASGRPSSRSSFPSSLGGIVTGTLLAVARVAGETAPIIFASSLAANVVSWDPSQALSTLPFSIFIYSESPDPHDHELAWAAALLLMMFVLVLSFLGRVFLARNRRKFEGASRHRQHRARPLHGAS